MARCTENELRRQIEFLKAEDEMLRKRVPKQRIFLKKEEKARLLKIGVAIGPGVHKFISIVHPRTYQRWMREKNCGKPAKKMGRPKKSISIKEIAIRLARETGWGYRRILGELKKLRIHSISRTTVKNILQKEDIKPSPKRGRDVGRLSQDPRRYSVADRLLSQNGLGTDRLTTRFCIGVHPCRHATRLLFALYIQARFTVDASSS